MTEGPEDRRSPLTPALALRVAIVGSVVLALFAVVFFRLWFLQVLTGSQYVRAAAVNRTRDVPIAPPRGEILDSSGKVLVSSTTALAVKIVPTEMPVAVNASNILSPPKRDARVYNRLARVLKMSTKRTHCTVPVPPPSCNTTTTHCAASTTVRLAPVGCLVAQQVALATYADVNVKSPVATNVQYYIAERQNEFPGVEVQQVSVTGYPDGELAAQALGTVGRITAAQLKEKAFKSVNRNAVIGTSGLEAQYDDFLRGSFGKQLVDVNADGIPTGQGRTVQPTAGDNLQTSLNAQLQKVGQNALQESMTQNDSPGGAFVALDPQTGSVYALGSLPSFNPSPFANPDGIPESVYKRLTDSASGDPLLDRAIQSVGPTGSTFKPITATAALESGDWGLDDTFDDTGQYCVGTGLATQCRHNSGHVAYGDVNLISALKVSDDDFFYNLGAKTNVDVPLGGPVDTWARKFGIGRSPGIDLPGAATGTLPDPAWRAQRNRDEADCDAATGPFRYTNATGTKFSATKRKGYHRSPTHSPGGCGIADGTDRPWSIGDNESLAVGQGDVQVSPLQLAVAYSALANGGTIVRPHIGESIQDADGTVLQKIDPPPARHIDIDPFDRQAILTGLREAASAQGGTSADVMGTFGQQVYGKTGTAQYFTAEDVEHDYAWYSCFVPASATSKPIEVVVWVEKGGFGDVAAAPVARQILSQWFYGKPGPYVAGTSNTL